LVCAVACENTGLATTAAMIEATRIYPSCHLVLQEWIPRLCFYELVHLDSARSQNSQSKNTCTKRWPIGATILAEIRRSQIPVVHENDASKALRKWLKSRVSRTHTVTSIHCRRKT
jgi:hypothetical protein